MQREVGTKIFYCIQLINKLKMSDKKVCICLAYCVKTTNLKYIDRLPDFWEFSRYGAFLSRVHRALCEREFYKNGDRATIARKKFAVMVV